MKSVLYWSSETWLLKHFQTSKQKWLIPQQLVQLRDYNHHLRWGKKIFFFIIYVLFYIFNIHRREWEPGIRVRRKIGPKESNSEATSSLVRSRSNSHSSKQNNQQQSQQQTKEPKSGEGNGSVVQDSGFSTETSSSKETHSASSTNGASQVKFAHTKMICKIHYFHALILGNHYNQPPYIRHWRRIMEFTWCDT